MRPRSSPVRTWQPLGGRDVSGSSVGAMQPSSDAEKAGAVLSHCARGEVPQPQHSTWAALTGGRPGCHWELQSPGTFVTLQLCLQVPVTSPALESACVECSIAELWEPFPSLTPFLPPSAPCWHFPCCHHIPTCFLVDPSLCTWSPFSWLLPPRVVHGGPPVSPWLWEVGGFCTPQRLKGRAAFQVLPAQESPFRSPPHPWKHAVL